MHVLRRLLPRTALAAVGLPAFLFAATAPISPSQMAEMAATVGAEPITAVAPRTPALPANLERRTAVALDSSAVSGDLPTSRTAVSRQLARATEVKKDAVKAATPVDHPGVQKTPGKQNGAQKKERTQTDGKGNDTQAKGARKDQAASGDPQGPSRLFASYNDVKLYTPSPDPLYVGFHEASYRVASDSCRSARRR